MHRLLVVPWSIAATSDRGVWSFTARWYAATTRPGRPRARLRVANRATRSVGPCPRPQRLRSVDLSSTLLREPARHQLADRADHTREEPYGDEPADHHSNEQIAHQDRNRPGERC